VLYVLYTLGLLANLDAVLTLPGRIREELDRGKTARTAISEGFDHAFSAIFDTSAVAVLTSMVLYQYGTGPVQGFAVTLIAGLIAGMFTSIFVVRTFFLLWLYRSRGAQTLSI
jgi:preprotein translocase subunit SecD